MAAIGIDLGSNKAVMGVVKRNGIDVVLNDGSNRSTPVQVAYQRQERLIGDSVKIQAKRNFKNTVMFPGRFLGLNMQCQKQLELEQRFITHKIVAMANNKLGFEVTQGGNVHTLTPEQVIAFYLVKLHEFYQKAEVTTKDVVVTIPSYASNTERQALVDACEIAGLNCLRVINESTAIAYNYGFFRKADLPTDKDRIVAFVDMGHSKTTVTIAAFRQKEAKILVHKSDRNLGGRDMDCQIMEKLGEEFAAKYGDDPRKNARCRLRMLETIEKARKTLSGDTEAGINIDYLLNDEDLNRRIKREEFQNLIDPQVRQLTTLLGRTLEASGLTADQVEFVELVGDCTRTPIVIDIIKQVFGKQELQRTLNSTECIARGAALNSAMIVPNFSVQEFKMNDYNSLPVTVNYQFIDKETNQPKDPKEYPNFFQIGQNFPMVQQLKFDNKEGNFILKLDYSQEAELMPGLPTTIAQYDVGQGKRSKADVPGCTTRLAIRVRNNVNQIPELAAVQMTEHWVEEEKIPIKTAGGKAPPSAPKEEQKAAEEPKPEGDQAQDAAKDPAEQKPEEKPAEQPPPEEQKFEIKNRKKERTVDVKYSTISHAIPSQMKTQYRGLEDQLMIEDRKVLDLKEAKYMLESFMYEMKNGVAEYGNYEHFIDPTLRAAYLENLQETETWIYADGENAPLEDQRARLEALQAVGLPVKMRHRFWNELDGYVSIYQKFAQRAAQQMGEVPHLTQEQRDQIQSKCDVMQTFLMETKSAIESKPKHEDPPTTLAEIDKKQGLLEAEVTAILTAPPPKPKKEEEKKEGEQEPAPEQPAGEQPAKPDEEMKDEEKPAEAAPEEKPMEQ